MSYIIKELRAENVKKLTVVDIKPDGSMVQICGANGAGKSSVLDSIWYALAGERNLPTVPIRTGQEQATIKLDLGDITVTRIFKRKKVKEGDPKPKLGEDYTTSVVVEAAVVEGKAPRFRNPQTMLDSLLGTLTFDPLAFARMEPQLQFASLRKFVPDVDFVAIDKANKTDFDARTEANRKAKEARAAAGSMTVNPDAPQDPVDENVILEELTNASQTNTEIEREKARRATMLAEISSRIDDAKTARERAAKVRSDAAVEAVRILEAAKVQAAAVTERATKESAQLEELAAEDEAHAESLKGDHNALPPVADPVDVNDLRDKLEAARLTNKAIEVRRERDAWLERAKAFETTADGLTTQIDARNADKIAKISAAEMPVEGISFGDGNVLLNGLPLDQASDAERLRLSCAIAMAQNAKLKIVRIRDGSLLDENALAMVAKMAEERGFQVWIERVDTTGKVGVVLEDGHVKEVTDAG